MNKEHKEVNYLSLFILGLSLLSTGLIFTAAINPVFIGIMASGLGLMAIALANRDKWYTTKKKTRTNQKSPHSLGGERLA